MNVAFRLDSSNSIGAGHLRRCLKLAEDLKHKSKKIIFITKNLKGNFNNLIKKKKFKIVTLKNEKTNKKLINDFEDTKNICEKFKINTLIVDHYFLGLSWEKKIRKHVNKLVIIDDFSKKEHNCDLIINNYSKKNNTKIKRLNGIQYSIIPNSRIPNIKRKEIKKETKLIIGTFFGSTDSKNCTERLLKILLKKKFKAFTFISIVGKNNKNKKKIKKNFQKYKNIVIKENFKNMKNFFKKINVLINVGGITSLEAMCNNIKCIYIPFGYYQKTTCAFLKLKKISNILNYSKVFSSKGEQLLFNSFKNLYKENNKIFKKKYLDGKGSKRVADFILSKKFNKI